MATCELCHSAYDISPSERAFLGKMTLPMGKNTIELSAPPHCPDCRLKIRVAHRNEQNLYRTKSAKSGKDIVSLYAPEPVDGGKPWPVWTQEEWRDESFDPLVYGRDYDPSRSFLEQFAELQRTCPRMALITLGNENSEYTTGTGYCKNCYLINSSENCEDCYYGKLLQKCRDSVDCSYLYDSELCYECFSVYDSYACTHLHFSKNCRDCLFSSNLQGCANCCLCVNLTRKEYHFLNEPLEKNEYEKRVRELLGSRRLQEEALKKLAELERAAPKKYANIVNCQDCTGDYLENSKNCTECYDVNDGQDCDHVTVGVQTKDCMHCSNMYIKPELCYETLGTIEAYHVAYCLYAFHSQRMLYCDTVFNCSDCFGCTGLTRKKYCILNKQYTKEEYEALVPKIVEAMKASGEFGRFFPAVTSPFGYNESLAADYFPLAESEARKQGFLWRKRDDKEYGPATLSVPDTIADITDDILKALLACTECGKNYRIVQQELAFYRKRGIPVPSLCPDSRHRRRMSLRNPRKLWERQCAKCKKAVRSTFSPDRPEILYCEPCYLEAVC